MARVGRTIGGLVAVALAAAACAGVGEPRGGPEEPRDVAFSVVATGSAPDAGVKAQAVVVRSSEDLELALAELGLDLPALHEQASEIDVGDRAGLVLLGGCQPDAGYRVELEALSEEGGQLLITARVVRPPEAVAAQVLSLPWLLASFDARGLPEEIRWTLQMQGGNGCGQAIGDGSSAVPFSP